MKTKEEREHRKLSRDFKGKVELAKKTPLSDLEEMFSEYYDECIEFYLRIEKEKHPNISEKEILIGMHKLSDKLKGKKHNK